MHWSHWRELHLDVDGAHQTSTASPGSTFECWLQHLCLSNRCDVELRVQLLCSILFPGPLRGGARRYNTVYETHVATGDTVEAVSPHRELAGAVQEAFRHTNKRHRATQQI